MVRRSLTSRLIWSLILFVILLSVFFVIAMAVTKDVSLPEASPTVVAEDASLVPGVQLPLPNLDGAWVAENNGARFEATVSTQDIVINFVNNGSSMIYWNGSFNSQSASGVTVVSNKIDIDELVLSNADAKDFLIENDTISFEFKAMGMSKIVVMTRA